MKASFDGDVIDTSTGKGIAGARVILRAGPGESQTAIADAQGHFHFAGLEFQSYQADARHPGYISSQTSAAFTLAPSHPHGQVRVELRPYSVIAGKVTDAFGVPLEGAQVEALQRYPAGEQRRGAQFVEGGFQYAMAATTYTDDRGEYRLAPLLPGSYYLMARAGANQLNVPPSQRLPVDSRARVTFYPRALKLVDAQPAELAEGKELRVEFQVLRQTGAQVTGRIFGLPTAPASIPVLVRLVALSPGASNAFGDVIGDRFTARDLLPGKYLIEAGYYRAGDFSYQTALGAARQTIDIASQDVDGVEMTLAPTPDLAGTVAFESGCTAVPVWIQLQSDPLDRVPINLQVDADGRFVMPHLFPGKYKAYVQPDNRAAAFAKSAKLGDVEVLADGFEATAETSGPLRITMGCGRSK
jgi:hypothetical protein